MSTVMKRLNVRFVLPAGFIVKNQMNVLCKNQDVIYTMIAHQVKTNKIVPVSQYYIFTLYMYYIMFSSRQAKSVDSSNCWFVRLWCLVRDCSWMYQTSISCPVNKQLFSSEAEFTKFSKYPSSQRSTTNLRSRNGHRGKKEKIEKVNYIYSKVIWNTPDEEQTMETNTTRTPT